MTNILFKIARICNSQLRCNYLKNEKIFLNFWFHFWNLHQISNILKEKMFVIANVFAKLQTAKNLVRTLSKKRWFRTRFDSQHMKVSEILGKSLRECFCHVFSSSSGIFIWKMSPLVLGEILGVFVNTLTANDKYPAEDCDNLPVSMQMELSKKRKCFSESFVPFLESTWSFKHSE